MMTSQRLDKLSKASITILFIGIALILMYMVAVQQKEIDTLIYKERETSRILSFMQVGERFTFQDGLVLYMLCDKTQITNEGGKAIKAIYDEFGATAFRNWILTNGKHKE